MVDRIPVQYWTDPLCIWAYVAQARLEHLLDSHGANLDVAYHIVPVFGSVPHRFTHGAWAKAGPEGRATVTRKVAHARGYENVSGEVWVKDPPASSWAPSLAVKAAFAAAAADEVEDGVAADYQWQLRERFFVDDVNVARRAAQLEVAEAVGLPRASLEARLDDGTAMAALLEDHMAREALKLQGSPTYVFDGGRAILYGNFDPAILDATIEALERGLHLGGTEC